MLRDQKGIHSIKVALLAERAIVEYDPALWTADKLVNVSKCLLPKPRLNNLLTILTARKSPILASTLLCYHPPVPMLSSYGYTA